MKTIPPLEALLQFFTERPLVVEKLKSLELDLNTRVNQINLANLGRSLELLRAPFAMLRLTYLSLHLDIDRWDVATAPRTYPFLLQLAQSKVRKYFLFFPAVCVFRRREYNLSGHPITELLNEETRLDLSFNLIWLEVLLTPLTLRAISAAAKDEGLYAIARQAYYE